ncbi:MAG: ABC transporter permease [Lachnospiraceae bacterium]|nr:ABC transporter permease [Lachnospiraceae bacterium]
MRLRLTRLYLINKRLFLSGSFLFLMLLIPVTAALLSLVSAADKGVVTIALAAESGPEAETGKLADCMSRLKAESRIVRFLDAGSEEEARQLAAQGRADAAWVFAAGYEDRLTRIAEGGRDILVRVYTPEDTVFMKLAREKLFAAVYPDLSRQIYRTFIKTALPAETSSNAADPDACYGMSASPNDLIRFSLMDGGPGADAAEAISEDYLLLPVRGMLAVLIFSAGMAASIFFLLDRERGCFIWLTDRETALTGAFYTGSAVFWTSLMSLAALRISGTFTSAGHELILMLLYAAAVGGQCGLLRKIAGKPGITAVILPALILLTLCLCPVFLNFRTLRGVAALLPAFHYLHGVRSVTSARHLILCAAAYLVLDQGCQAAGSLLSRFRRG